MRTGTRCTPRSAARTAHGVRITLPGATGCDGPLRAAPRARTVRPSSRTVDAMLSQLHRDLQPDGTAPNLRGAKSSPMYTRSSARRAPFGRRSDGRNVKQRGHVMTRVRTKRGHILDDPLPAPFLPAPLMTRWSRLPLCRICEVEPAMSDLVGANNLTIRCPYRISYRPGGHMPTRKSASGDCAHYCIPGPIDEGCVPCSRLEMNVKPQKPFSTPRTCLAHYRCLQFDSCVAWEVRLERLEQPRKWRPRRPDWKRFETRLFRDVFSIITRTYTNISHYQSRTHPIDTVHAVPCGVGTRVLYRVSRVCVCHQHGPHCRKGGIDIPVGKCSVP